MISMADLSFNDECRYCKKLDKKLKEEQNNVSRMQNIFWDSQVKLQKAQDACQNLESVYDTLTKEVRDYCECNRKLLNGLDKSAFQENVEEYKNLYARLKRGHDILNSDVCNTKSSEAKALKKLDQAVYEMDVVKNGNEDLKGYIENLKMEQEQLHKRLNECKNSYNELEYLHLTLQSEHDALKREQQLAKAAPKGRRTSRMRPTTAPAVPQSAARPRPVPRAPTAGFTFIGARGAGVVPLRDRSCRKGNPWK